MSTCYAYIRTSTIKQGTEGVSLEAQRDAIAMYATRNNITIIEWFSETQTAAKRGRPIFTRMMKALTNHKVDGLILHRIDRGSRNLRDWSDISDLSDLGLQVHFAHDAIDLGTRGGRLAADVQAVVAADFIRNLREETRKGILGRLKQGYYPFGAPIGYCNNGRAQAKTIDPVIGPLVVLAFELYASGGFGFHTLRAELHRKGFRTKSGKPLSLKGLSTMLGNPFYVGLMRLRSTGEMYQGVHTPLIKQSVFDRVQDVLHGRVTHRGLKHDHLFRRDIVCVTCGYKLIGETQKGRVYYRCHTKSCPSTSLNEVAVSKVLHDQLLILLHFFQGNEWLATVMEESIADLKADVSAQIAALKLQRDNVTARLSATTDAVIEGLIDKETYLEKKNDILRDRARINEMIALSEAGEAPQAQRARSYLELNRTLRSMAFARSTLVARQSVKPFTSNFVASGKSVTLQWVSPFDVLLTRAKEFECDPTACTRRTLEELAAAFLPVGTTRNNVLTSLCPR